MMRLGDVGYYVHDDNDDVLDDSDDDDDDESDTAYADAQTGYQNGISDDYVYAYDSVVKFVWSLKRPIPLKYWQFMHKVKYLCGTGDGGRQIFT